MFNRHFFKLLLIAMAVAVPVWLICKVLLRNKSKERGRSQWYLFRELIFILYGILVATITIIPLAFSLHKAAGAQGINLVPLKNTIAIINHAAVTNNDFVLPRLMENVYGNILLFMPLGFLLPLLRNRKTYFSRIFFSGLFLSTAIESIQWIERSYGVYRSVDMDDIILNTLGGVLGWLVYLLVRLLNPVMIKA